MLCTGGKLLSLKAYLIETFPLFPVNTSYVHVNLTSYANTDTETLCIIFHQKQNLESNDSDLLNELLFSVIIMTNLSIVFDKYFRKRFAI